MIEDADLHAWFYRQVLPLEGALTRFIKQNWRTSEDVQDIRQEVYEAVLTGVREEFPIHAAAYVYTIARNIIINRSRRAKIVSFELVADFETGDGYNFASFQEERQITARDELRRAMQGLNELPARCREVVRLRKVEGLSTRETAAHMGVSTHTVERQLTLGMRALANFMLGGSGKIDRTPNILRRRGRMS